MRQGLSLIEILFMLAVAAILAAMAAPPYITLRDRAAVRSATTASVAAFDAMRALALSRARHAAMHIDTANARLVVHSFSDTLLRVPLGAAWQVHLATTRDSTAIAPDGLGYGAANTRLTLARGAVAETISVSRLGRVLRR